MAIKVTLIMRLQKTLQLYSFMTIIFQSLLFQLLFHKLAFDLDLQFVITLVIKSIFDKGNILNLSKKMSIQLI